MGYIDVLPTILKSTGVDPAAAQVAGRELDGSSLCSLFDGNESSFPERDWYSWHGQSGPERETIAIKTPQWKLVIIGPDIRKIPISDRHQVHLYKMPDDLLEANNLADRHPEIVQTLYTRLQTYRSLQPQNAVPVFGAGKQEFTPWKDWRIPTRIE